MIIDMHTHVYPEKIAKRAVEKLSKAADIPAQSNGMKSGLQESMKRAGVDYSLLLPVATSVKQVDKMNQEAVAANECAGETGLISFGAIHPDTPDYKEVLSWLADHDVRGIKLHPDYQGTFFDDIRMERIVDKATELGLYTVVHGGIDIGLPDPGLFSKLFLRHITGKPRSDHRANRFVFRPLRFILSSERRIFHLLRKILFEITHGDDSFHSLPYIYGQVSALILGFS